MKGDHIQQLHEPENWQWQLLEDGSLPSKPSDIPRNPRYKPVALMDSTSDYAMLNAKRRKLHHQQLLDEDDFCKPKIVADKFYIQSKTRVRQPDDQNTDQIAPKDLLTPMTPAATAGCTPSAPSATTGTRSSAPTKNCVLCDTCCNGNTAER